MGCIKFAKYFIAAVNLLILIACCIIMGVCYSKLDSTDGKEYYDLFKKSTGFMIFIMVLVFCFVVCVIGFLLFCCENKIWRVLYCVCLVVVVVSEIACIIVLYTYTDTALDYVNEQWMLPENNKSVYAAEHHFVCCGFRNRTDEDKKRCENYPANTYNKSGIDILCVDSLKGEIDKNLRYFAIGTIVILVVEVLLLIFSIYYAWLPKERVEGIE